MQHGLFMGLFMLVTLACFIAGFSYAPLTLIFLVLCLLYPFMIACCTHYFRKAVAPTERFTLFRGFSHALMTMVYAALWGAIGTYLYMQFFDKGHLAYSIQQAFSEPRMQEMIQANHQLMNQQGQQHMSMQEMIEQFQNIPATIYAESILYWNIITAPIIALFVGLGHMRLRSKDQQIS